MGAVLLDDPVLIRFGEVLRTTYGSRLDKAVLYGSRARQQARPDSDYDIAVFLKDFGERGLELTRLADITTDILYETGGCIHAMAYPANRYDDRSPLMREVRTAGLFL